MTDVQDRIAQLVQSQRVFLFMKGTPAQPRCGFSAQTVETLGQVAPGFGSFDVLSDESIRQGIKEFANWPTIPQLYIDGEFVGGCDIVNEMYNSGELHQLLGVAAPARVQPTLQISDAAAAAIRSSLDAESDEVLHLKIDGRFQHQFMLKARAGNEIVAESNGIAVHFDVASAARASGLEIDWVDALQGSGLRIRNPNAPKPVQQLSVQALKAALDSGTAPLIIDVRPAVDRAKAQLPATRSFEDERAALEALPKDTPLAFLCHHGNSSQRAAEHFKTLGFTEVSNIQGGIDAWARAIDRNVPVY
jgi:monothiol glutaredoxin